MAVSGNALKMNPFVFKLSCALAALITSVGLSTTKIGAQTPAPIDFGSRDPNLILVDGSSTVFPITEAVAEEFQNVNSSINVAVGVSGTGGGFKKFCAGEIYIADASRPIKQSEVDACAAAGIKYVELPVAFDALTVAVNPQNTWASSLTVDELKKIWEAAAEGKIDSWDDVRPGFPNEPLSLYGPGTDSGTFDYFKEAILGKDANGKQIESRADFTASEDDNILVQGIAGSKGALGYFGFAYYLSNQDRIKAVSIVNPKTGTAVEPSVANVETNRYVPLSRPLLIYVNADAAAFRQTTLGRNIRSFVNYYMDNAGELSAEVGYVPLPQRAYELSFRNFNLRKVGSVFLGRNTVGLKIEDILQLEAK